LYGIDALKKAGDIIFAHRNILIDLKKFVIPSVDDLDGFFGNLENLYYELSSKIDNSPAWFGADTTRSWKTKENIVVKMMVVPIFLFFSLSSLSSNSSGLIILILYPSNFAILHS